jgi:hypothetical protein
VVVVLSKERFRYMKLSKLNINLKKEDGGILSLSLSSIHRYHLDMVLQLFFSLWAERGCPRNSDRVSSMVRSWGQETQTILFVLLILVLIT